MAVAGLFGDRDISFDLPEGDAVNFLHGPNGAGKSTVLRMLLNLLTRNFVALQRTPFVSFRVVLDSAAGPAAERPVAILVESVEVGLRVTIDRGPTGEGAAAARGNSGSWQVERFTDADRLDFERHVERHLPGVVYLPNGRYWDQTSARELTLAEVLALIAERAPADRPVRLGYPPELDLAMPDIDVEYIGADRLRNDLALSARDDGQSPGTGSVAALYRHQDALARRIQHAQAEYSLAAQQLDRSFPLRLVQQSDRSAPSVAEIQRVFEVAAVRRDALVAVGLVDPMASELPELRADQPEWIRVALAVYQEDLLAKLDSLAAFAERLTAFTDLVNAKFNRKTLEISRNHGFIVRDRAGRELDPSALSSGEQHQVLLLYRLLFRDRSGTLYLIDEPEISLHVAWQEAFVEDAMVVARLNEAQVLIATHSPVIIGEHFDLLVDVTGPESDVVEEESA